MLIIIGLLLAYLILPYLGLFNYNGFGGQVSQEMIYLYTLHIFLEISIIFIFVYLISNRKNTLSNQILFYNYKKIQKLSIIILLIIIFINLFIFGNYHILLGDIGRGEFRTTLHFGFLYLFFSFYLPGAILALNTYFYSQYILIKKNIRYRKKIFMIFILSMIIGFLTGFKSTAIMIALMGVAGLSNTLKLKNLIIIIGIFILIMAISGYVFMNFSNFNQVFKYLFLRATSIAVDGTVGTYNLFPNGGNDSYLILLYNLGNHLASLIYGVPKNSIEYLQIDLGRLIGYLTYPPVIAAQAISGAFNLTITNFGEAIYLLGKNYFFIYTLFVSIYIGMLLYLLKKSTFKLRIVLIVYFVTSVAVGGGKITNMFALTTFVYLIGVYIFITLLLKYSRRKY